jgi:putative resolvase
MYILNMLRKMISIQEAADFLGVAPQTLRPWEREGRLVPDERTPGGRRRDDLARLRPEQFHAPETARRTLAYARVSSHDQNGDLQRQKQVLERYRARQGWTFEVIADLGSGMNYHKKGLKRLLGAIIEGTKDVLEIIAVFSARLYGSRSRKNQKITEGVKAAVEAAQC